MPVLHILENPDLSSWICSSHSGNTCFGLGYWSFICGFFTLGLWAFGCWVLQRWVLSVWHVGHSKHYLLHVLLTLRRLHAGGLETSCLPACLPACPPACLHACQRACLSAGSIGSSARVFPLQTRLRRTMVHGQVHTCELCDFHLFTRSSVRVWDVFSNPGFRPRMRNLLG